MAVKDLSVRTVEPDRVVPPFHDRKAVGNFAVADRLRPWSIRSKILRRQLFLRYRLPKICPVEDVNFEAFDRVAVFTKSKIAFNRLKKNANSTAMIALTCLETGQLLNDRRKAKHDANRMDSVSSLICDLSSFDWLLIVRDPYSRTLSAFLEKFQHESYIRSGLSPVLALAQGWRPQRRL
jgi:hypothetical protein